MFTKDNIKYLDSHRDYYDKLNESGSLSRISSVVVKGFQDVYREAVGKHKFNVWCPACVVELIELCYLNYDKFVKDEEKIRPVATDARPGAPGKQPRLPKFEGKGKILHKRGGVTKQSGRLF